MRWNPSALYLTTALLPIAGIIIGTFSAYTLQHVRTEYLPSIPELVSYMPESRIFSVCMIITSMLMIPGFVIIRKIFQIRARNEQISTTRQFVALDIILQIASGLAILSLLCVSCITYRESSTLFLVFGAFFIFSLLIYFVVFDLMIHSLRLNENKFDYIYDIVTSIILLLTIILKSIKNSGSTFNSSRSVVEFILICLVFCRFLFLWFRMPKVHLILTRKAI